MYGILIGQCDAHSHEQSKRNRKESGNKYGESLKLSDAPLLIALHRFLSAVSRIWKAVYNNDYECTLELYVIRCRVLLSRHDPPTSLPDHYGGETQKFVLMRE